MPLASSPQPLRYAGASTELRSSIVGWNFDVYAIVELSLAAFVDGALRSLLPAGRSLVKTLAECVYKRATLVFHELFSSRGI